MTLFAKTSLLVGMYQICAGAQTSTGPTLGWALAPDGHSVHTVFGVPGASRLGPARRLPAGLARLAANPAAFVAAAVDERSHSPVLLNMGTFDQMRLEQAWPNPDVLTWSSLGTALALLYREQQVVQIFASKSGVWRLQKEVPAVAGQIAISDSGSTILALTPEGLAEYGPSGASVLAKTGISGFTFLAGSETAAYWNEGYLRAGNAMVPFAKDPAEQVLLASPARGTLIAVRSGSGRVTTLNAAGETIGEARCDCAVLRLETFGASGAVRLATSDGGPLWVASAVGEPRVFFVPADAFRRHVQAVRSGR